ncbi:alpha/beta hydrolase [Paraburkholderia sp. J63]|uniref:alpha/beta fold hydrolase n=1 Tax=Paraburkholderia sp. J63 TaxID=2805434 RepID=UPI002ABE66C4|nr:alpha/beta hydrolase [Paraburkholderia sp. J63]
MTRTLTIRGVRYAFDETGSGPLVLFGHGLFFDREMFRAQSDALSGTNRCVRIDWPGHGQSGWLADGWRIDDLVDDTLALIDALGEQRVILVGLSQGAAVFTRTALAAPHRVRALVIMNSTPLRPVDSVRAGMLENSAELSTGDEARIEAVFRRVAGRMFCAHTREHHRELVEQALVRFRRHPVEGLAHAVKLGLSYESIVERLDELTMPVGVIWGADDPISTLDIADLYTRKSCNAQRHLIAHAGHCAPLEQPVAVNTALITFLHGLHEASHC